MVVHVVANPFTIRRRGVNRIVSVRFRRCNRTERLPANGAGSGRGNRETFGLSRHAVVVGGWSSLHGWTGLLQHGSYPSSASGIQYTPA